MQLTDNFNTEEFNCNDGTKVPCVLMGNVGVLAAQLQQLRDHIGIPIHINSAYRTKPYNTSIGGSPKSQHLEAKAADIRTNEHTPKELAAIVEDLIAEGKMKIGGLGIYPTFIHVDTRETKTRW